MNYPILFLDDCPVRTAEFQVMCPSAKTVTTAKEAIEILESQERFNFVFLDHDLGGEVYVDSVREDCGMEVVRWLVTNRRFIGDIIVHTHNPNAGECMMRDLASAGYGVTRAPFMSSMFKQIARHIG